MQHNIKKKEELSPISLLESDTLGGVGPDSVTDFDLYINIGGHMVLYAPKPYKWAKEEIERLRSDGHSELFYEKDCTPKVEIYRKLCQMPTVSDKLEPSQRIEGIIGITSEFSKTLFTHDFTLASLEKAKQISNQLLSCIQEKPSCIKALEKVKDHHAYTFQHSGRVAAYTIAMALKMSMNSEHNLENIALGCLLHDVGKSGVQKEILDKQGPLKAKEWQMVKQHPEFGVKLVASANLPLVPIEIILHHHEREDGGGYPHNLKSSELLTEVKIAAFADIFDALTSRRPYQKTRSRFEALDFIKFNLMDHIYKDAYKALVALLSTREQAS